MRAKFSCFMSILAQRAAYRLWESSIEHAVPETSGDAVAFVDPTGTVVVQVVFLQAPKEGEPGIRKVQRVVQPFFADVALHNTCKHDGRGVNRKQKTDRGCDEKQRKYVPQFTADVPSIERPHMVIPVERIEPLMQEPPDDAFARRKAAVQDIAVETIFDESPGQATCRKESCSGPWVRCRKRDNQHEERVQSVEDSQRVETIASVSGLTPLVDRKGDFRGPLRWRRNECGF